jgi:hypothetical protein
MQRGYGVRIQGNGNRVIGSTISEPWYAAVYIRGETDGPPASNNVVGGTEPGEGNVLSAGNDGVRIDGPAADNLVVGNVLSGKAGGVRIRAGATGNRIGGPTPAERNIISGAGRLGSEGCPTGEQIQILDAPGNIIQGNYIGTTPDGLQSQGQKGTAGIEIRDSSGTIVRDNVIGGILVTGANHCLGDRFGTAVLVWGSSSGTIVEGNLIGTDANGQNPMTNREGVAVRAWPGSGTPVATVVQGNLVGFSELDGVSVGPNVSGVTISGNSIFDNTGLGIDLSGTGNDGQQAPLLTSAVTDDMSVTIEGTLSSTPNGSFAIELFASPSCDPSGFGEGRTFLGSTTVVTDGAGWTSFELTLPVVVLEGSVLTATATQLATGNTSEFSGCEVVVMGPCATAPLEVQGLYVDSNQITVSWTPFGPSVLYDLVRGYVDELSVGSPAASCLVTESSQVFYDDVEVPTTGRVFYYVVRARNACGVGPWGTDAVEANACP